MKSYTVSQKKTTADKNRPEEERKTFEELKCGVKIRMSVEKT